MKGLTDYIHAAASRRASTPRPARPTAAVSAAAYQHEAQDARRFAEWGFDFLKYDWCSYGGVAGGKDIAHLKKPYG